MTDPKRDEYKPPVSLFNEEIEERVLCNILQNNVNFYRAGDLLNESLFFNDKNQKLFGAITAGIAKGKVVDNIYLAQEAMREKDLTAYSFQEIIDKFGQYVPDAMLAQDIAYLRELRQRRKFWELGHKLVNIGSDLSYPIEDAETEINNALQEEEKEADGVLSMAEANEQMMKRVMDNIKGVSNTFIPTGFHEIDDYSGFQTTDFNLIAAATSMGKTSIAIEIAISAAKAGIPVMIYSMEMRAMQLAARINSPFANVSSSLIQYKKLYEENFEAVKAAVERTNGLPIYFDDKATTSKQAILKSMRVNAKKRGIKLFFVDYLQILSSIGGIKDEVRFLGETSREFKNIARELDVNVTALSQLARNTVDPMPTLDRVRGSAEIADATDTVMFIWRPSVYGKTSYKGSNAPVENTAQIIIAKGRNIGVGSFIVGFNPTLTQFYDIPEEEQAMWGEKETEIKEKEESPFKPPQPEEKALPF